MIMDEEQYPVGTEFIFENLHLRVCKITTVGRSPYKEYITEILSPNRKGRGHSCGGYFRRERCGLYFYSHGWNEIYDITKYPPVGLKIDIPKDEKYRNLFI